MKNEEPIYIYGLFDAEGICHYVGQTYNIRRRCWVHLSGNSSRFKGKPWHERILKTTTRLHANKWEKRIGRRYQRMGQAKENKIFTGGIRREPSTGGHRVLYLEGYPEPFGGLSAISRAVGCSPQTILNNLEGTVLGRGSKLLRVSASPITSEPKKQNGGARPGAGRPKLNRVVMVLTLHKATAKKIRRIAEERNQYLGEVVDNHFK